MRKSLYPNVVTNVDGQEQFIPLDNYNFMKKNMIEIVGEIDDWVAASVVSQLLYMDNKSDDDIILIINSPGGSVTAGMAIYDAMKYAVNCDVCTVATGVAASMGALLLAAGTKGKRYATPSAEIMIHQPLGGVQGQATDITLVAEHIQNVKKKLAGILAESCGKSMQELLNDMERDNWKTAMQAKEYGLIDSVGYPDYI